MTETSASDGVILSATLEARTSTFEKSFDRARRKAVSDFDSIERRSKVFSTRLESTMGTASKRVASVMSNFGAGLAGGIIGGAGVAGLQQLLQGIGKTAEVVAMVGSNAKKAGLDAKSFQELAHVADQNRISVDALADGMKELNLRADEWIVTGSGPAAEAFKRLGFSASELKDRLKDPSKLLVEIIGRLEQLDRAEQIRISDEIFGGTAGERFVELLDKGAAGIRAQIAEAHAFGLVLDDDVIKRADEIDRKFKLIAATIGTQVKGAVVDVASAMLDWTDGFNVLEEQQSRTLDQKLTDIGKSRLDIENTILKLQGQQADGVLTDYGSIEASATIKALEAESAELHETEKRILDLLGKRAEETKVEAENAAPAVIGLNNAIQNTATSTSAGASGLNDYASAMRALKNEIPELAEQLATLDARGKIDSAYRQALSLSVDKGERDDATALRDAALRSVATKGARDAAGKGMLDLIGYAEGTDKGRSYNETLGFGAFTGGPKNLVMMTLDQVDAMQTGMLQHPDNDMNSSAAGRYQIVQKTLRGLRGDLGLDGGEMFDAGMQDRLAEELLRRRGNDPAALRNEWEGLRRVDDATIRGAYDGTSTQMPAIDPSKAANIDKMREQADAYTDIIARSKEFTQTQGMEQQALSMTGQRAAALRYEQQMLAEAQRAGIALTAQQRAEISTLAGGMATAEINVQSFAEKQQQAAEVSRFFGQQAVDAISGLITGTTTAEQALQQLIGTLVKAALQAAILGEGPLAGIMGGGGGTTGGGGGGGFLALLGSLFGFADGGYTGHGAKYAPAGVVHRGEFVLNQEATRRIGVDTLDAMNSGHAPGYAEGGLVGRRKASAGYVAALAGGFERSSDDRFGALPAFSPPHMSQQISIAAPITVNGSAGTPEQNTDLAEKMGRQLDSTMRGIVADELRRQRRPGNSLGRVR